MSQAKHRQDAVLLLVPAFRFQLERCLGVCKNATCVIACLSSALVLRPEGRMLLALSSSAFETHIPVSSTIHVSLPYHLLRTYSSYARSANALMLPFLMSLSY